MEAIGTILLETNPWWFVAVALILVIIDLAIISTEYLLFIGVSALLLLIPRLLTDSPSLMAWAIPAALLISYLTSGKLLKLAFRRSELFEPGKNIIGVTGTITMVDSENYSLGAFYSYRRSIPHENVISSDVDITLRVTLPDGQVLPITNQAGLKVNEAVTIIGYDGVNATVAKSEGTK